MLLCMEVGLGPGNIVFDGVPAPPKRGTSAPTSAHVYCGQMVTHLSNCWALVVALNGLLYVDVLSRYCSLGNIKLVHRSLLHFVQWLLCANPVIVHPLRNYVEIVIFPYKGLLLQLMCLPELMLISSYRANVRVSIGVFQCRPLCEASSSVSAFHIFLSGEPCHIIDAVLSHSL